MSTSERTKVAGPLKNNNLIRFIDAVERSADAEAGQRHVDGFQPSIGSDLALIEKICPGELDLPCFAVLEGVDLDRAFEKPAERKALQLESRWFALLSASIFGLSFSICPTSVTAYVRKNLPEASWGRSVALFTTAFAIGQTIGPVAAGAVADATQSLSLGLFAAGGVLVFASVVSAMQKPLK